MFAGALPRSRLQRAMPAMPEGSELAMQSLEPTDHGRNVAFDTVPTEVPQSRNDEPHEVQSTSMHARTCARMHVRTHAPERGCS